MKKFSITSRITLWYAAFLVVISVLLMIVLLRYYDFREQSMAEKELIKTVEDVSDRIVSSGENFAGDPEIVYYEKDTYVSVYDKNGAFLVGRVPDGIESFPEILIDQTQILDDENGGQWYVYDTTVYMKGSEDCSIRGIMKNTGYEATGDRLWKFFIYAVPALIVIAMAGGWLIVRGSLMPLRDLISVTNEVRKDADLSRRVPVPKSHDETSELAESINGMFDRIEEVVGRERQFASDVSHELRTPLTIIRTQSEYAMEDPDYAERALRTINRESHRMSNLITSLLTIARSEAGRLHPDMEALELVAILADLAEQAGIAASDRDISVEFINKTGQDRVMVLSDEDVLIRIVLNLLDNAVRYGKSPGGRIEMKLDTEGTEAVCTFADDGKGIVTGDESKIWGRFYQSDGSRSRNDSAGLGLAMVESLTRSLGGSIRLIPEEQRAEGELPGAVFELRLPLDSEQNIKNT